MNEAAAEDGGKTSDPIPEEVRTTEEVEGEEGVDTMAGVVAPIEEEVATIEIETHLRATLLPSEDPAVHRLQQVAPTPQL